MSKHGVTPHWWNIFISEYLTNGENAQQAYLVARPKVTINTAHVSSSTLLQNPAFLQKLEQKRRELSHKIDCSKEQWLKMLMERAMFDIRTFLDIDEETGDVKLVKDWKTKAGGHIINKIKIKTGTLESGMVMQSVEIDRDPKDSIKAIELLGKTFGYLSDTNINIGTSSEEIVKAFAKIRETYSKHNELTDSEFKTIEVEELVNAKIEGKD